MSIALRLLLAPLVATSVAAALVLAPVPSTGVRAAPCRGTAPADFNGDGHDDLAVAVVPATARWRSRGLRGGVARDVLTWPAGGLTGFALS